ncbi:MAG: cytochrome c biogenesis protein CcsA [Rhodospirillaceae bacterium]|nr:cytochrome c biogenesis protein CcsA [Rhodospirillaceae bacterium]
MPLALAISACVALLPLGIAVWYGLDRRPAVFWPLLAVAMAGTGALLRVEVGSGVPTSFSTALWLSVGACLVAYAALSAVSREGRRLAVFLVPFLILSGLLGAIWISTGPRPLHPEVGSIWIVIHVAASLATYALVALAAASGIAILVQERAIKRKARGSWSARLPSVAACEQLEVALLVAAAFVLGAGIATGMAWSYLRAGILLPLDHKTVLVLLAFLLVLGVLGLHRLTGLRGRAAARWVLGALLALVLAYPGVKFVSEILLGR